VLTVTSSDITTFQPAPNSSAAFAVRTAVGIKVLNVDTSAAIITFGTSSILTSQISLANATNGNFVGLQASTTSGSYTLSRSVAALAVSQFLQSGSSTASQLTLTSLIAQALLMPIYKILPIPTGIRHQVNVYMSAKVIWVRFNSRMIAAGPNCKDLVPSATIIWFTQESSHADNRYLVA
jgi:hypothetical protein